MEDPVNSIEPFHPGPGCGQRPGRTISHALTRALGPTAGRPTAANRSGFLAGRAGQSRGWREKGKSLDGRRAGPAASGSRGRRAACSLPAPLGLRHAVRGPEAAGRHHSSASIPDLASPCCRGLPGPSGPLAVLPARRAAGRKGNAGTRTPAAARAHCTLAAARPRHRASEPSVAPRQGPAPARPPSPGAAPAPPRPPQPPGNPRHPDNLPAVAQLVSAAKAPARRPEEVSFLRVPGNPAYTLSAAAPEALWLCGSVGT